MELARGEREREREAYCEREGIGTVFWVCNLRNAITCYTCRCYHSRIQCLNVFGVFTLLKKKTSWFMSMRPLSCLILLGLLPPASGLLPVYSILEWIIIGVNILCTSSKHIIVTVGEVGYMHLRFGFSGSILNLLTTNVYLTDVFLRFSLTKHLTNCKI